MTDDLSFPPWTLRAHVRAKRGTRDDTSICHLSHPGAVVVRDGPRSNPLQPLSCGHFIGTEDRHCHGTEGVRVFLVGYRCKIHTPAALKGEAEPPSAVAIVRRTITKEKP